MPKNINPSDPRAICWSDARDLGFKKYFTGLPCPRCGQIAERWVVSCGCVVCSVKQTNDYMKKKRFTPEMRAAKIATTQARAEQGLVRSEAHAAAARTRAALLEAKAKKKTEAQRIRDEREAARALGQIRYTPGVTCRRGHLAERYVATNVCVECSHEDASRPDTAYYRQQAKEKARGHAPRPALRDVPPAPEDGLCQCCGKPQSDGRITRLSLDHDHITGEFRGWLCSNCNNGIGLLGDDRRGLIHALAYLDRYFLTKVKKNDTDN